MESKSIELLTRLGLSITEAKIFVALHRNEPIAARTIAKSLEMSRELVYRTLPGLQEKGIVERIISNPQTFRRVSIKEACIILLHYKREEDKEISKLIEELPKDQEVVDTCAEDTISIIPANSENTYWSYRWKNVKKSVDIIISLKNMMTWLYSTAEQFISLGNNRNVKIRIIVKTNLEKKKIERALKSFQFIDFKFLDYRISYDIPISTLVIFDKTNLIICIKNDCQIERAKWLFTNNPLLVEKNNHYFEEQWQKLNELN